MRRQVEDDVVVGQHNIAKVPGVFPPLSLPEHRENASVGGHTDLIARNEKLVALDLQVEGPPSWVEYAYSHLLFADGTSVHVTAPFVEEAIVGCADDAVGGECS